MTSNAGASRIVSPKTLGFAARENKETDYKNMKDGVMDEVRRLFKPEFLNRIDELLTFGRLGKEQIRKIVDIQLQAVSARLEARRLHLIVTDAAKDFLADIGYDPLYGARPLKRAIQTELENKLAKELLSGAFVGKTDITVDAGKGGLTFKA